MTQVKLLIQVEFETKDEATANACIARIPGELQHQILEGKMGHAMTGVRPGSVRAEIAKKSLSD